MKRFQIVADSQRIVARGYYPVPGFDMAQFLAWVLGGSK